MYKPERERQFYREKGQKRNRSDKELMTGRERAVIESWIRDNEKRENHSGWNGGRLLIVFIFMDYQCVQTKFYSMQHMFNKKMTTLYLSMLLLFYFLIQF